MEWIMQYAKMFAGAIAGGIVQGANWGLSMLPMTPPPELPETAVAWLTTLVVGLAVALVPNKAKTA